MEGFRKLVDNHHSYAKDWKAKTDGKVLGYFCTYVPEEIIYAAGILPVRIIGSHESNVGTERHIANMYCSFCRDCLAQGLKGRYPYLDGIVKARSCQQIRQAFASWQLHVPVDYSYYIRMPAIVQSPHAKPFLVEELSCFKKSLEEWTGKQISSEAIKQAIETYNLNRRLLRQVYELRKDDEPPLSGAEALEMTLSSQLVDKAEHNRLLSEALTELRQTSQHPSAGVRLMLIGSENDDIDYVKLIESLGSTVVIDETCTGSRYFWNECSLDGDPLDAIASRYIERPPCPAKDLPEHRRFPHILKLIKDYKVEGVIVTLQRFCHNYESEIPDLESLFQREGIPLLVLEYSFIAPPNWYQNRIEAFLEMIQAESIWV
jgi:benzoyl-CoA reductase subunit C